MDSRRGSTASSSTALRESGKVRLVLSPVLFTRGSYGITVAIHDSRIQRYLDMRPRAATFMVDGPSVASREVSGHFVFPHRWEAVQHVPARVRASHRP